MQDSAKYLIHADITASGVVERSDVVGAIFGQTEGLLGDELDLRDLQESGKLGRIDVEIHSESGVSHGSITIASGLDKVETAILAAGLESIERVGPCRATVEIAQLEDVRSAKRRAVVERAKELLADFDDTALTSEELVEEVRQSLRVEDITEYEGLPAGPRVADSDAIVVVEGRSDVKTLLKYGVKNAVAVEGTNVPDSVADLTNERTVTAFLDGDRGGNLILKELAQVGDVDYVAFAPSDRSVEDLSRGEVMDALRDKVPYEAVADASDPVGAVTATDGSARPAPTPPSGERPVDESGTAASAIDAAEADAAADADAADADAAVEATASEDAGVAAADVDAGTERDASATPRPEERTAGQSRAESETANGDGETADGDGEAPAETGETPCEDGANSSAEPGSTEAEPAEEPQTLAGHVQSVIASDTGRVRLLDDSFDVLAEADAADAFETIESADTVPGSVVLDGELTQRVLDVAAQRGVEQVVARSEGEFVKRPADVRIRTAGDF